MYVSKMSRSRAYTRHQQRRAMARARRLLKTWDAGGDNPEWKFSESEKHVNLFAKTRRPCSCYACRNEKYDRQWEGKEPLKFEMEDYGRVV